MLKICEHTASWVGRDGLSEKGTESRMFVALIRLRKPTEDLTLGFAAPSLNLSR